MQSEIFLPVRELTPYPKHSLTFVGGLKKLTVELVAEEFLCRPIDFFGLGVLFPSEPRDIELCFYLLLTFDSNWCWATN